MPKNILITGANGFTGNHLQHELAQHGHIIYGLTHHASPDAKSQSVCADLLDKAALINALQTVQPDIIIHLAAISFVAHGDASAIYQTNVLGTRNLLDAIVCAGIQPSAVLLASSANIYGNASGGVIHESIAPAPANDYAVSKLAMEYMARLWMDKLPITIVRPFNYTGQGQSDKFLLPKIVRHFREKAPVLELGNLNVVRDFSDVRMVVDAYRRLLDCNAAGQIYNVCSGQGHALLDILQIMRELTGHSPEIRVNPAFVRANEVHTLIGDNQHLQQAIGPLKHFALQDTLRWMLEDTRI